jgi:hypothetical protein
MSKLTDRLRDGQPAECWECVQHGCHTADDKPIPCNCDLVICDCDDECICDCHKWANLVRRAAERIDALEFELSETKGMLKDAEHFRDYWFDRTLEIRNSLLQRHFRAS